MDSPSPDPEPAPRRHRRHRKNPTLGRAHGIWQDWWVEIVIGVLILLAIFLLVEQMDIRETFFGWLLAAVNALEGLITAAGGALVGFVRGATLSDLLAYVLILAVVGLLAWRTRHRILTSPRLSHLQCPRCGGDLYRIHRRWYHRLLNIVIPSRRYGCKDRACGWRGLRVKSKG